MKALKFENNSLTLAAADRPQVSGEVLVRVVKSGICSTDLEIVRGYAGFEGIIGHEFAGVVEESPEAPEWKGKRVVGEINAGCGVCPLCMTCDSRHCERRTVLGIKGRDGAHAEFVSLPHINLLEIPDNVSDAAAVFTEPLAAAIGITEQAEILSDTRLAVIGDGKLGLLCALSLGLLTRNAVLIGKHREKLAIAKRSGIETVLLEAAAKMNRSFDVVVEASGSESGFATALDLVRPRGTIVLKSTFHGMPKWEAWRIVVDEIKVVGSRCGRFAPALEMLAAGKINVDEMIENEYPLSKGVSAVRRAGEKGVLKVLLDAAR